jgi:CopG family transcriptional regulator, nickel-responsive regulator
MSKLERISITIEPELLAQLDEFVASSGHNNRSEAMRDLIRAHLVERSDATEQVTGVVAISYDHAQRELSDKLNNVAHEHHDYVLATTHVHLDRDHCLEMSALAGPRAALEHYADHIIGLKGVSHGAFVITKPTV